MFKTLDDCLDQVGACMTSVVTVDHHVMWTDGETWFISHLVANEEDVCFDVTKPYESLKEATGVIQNMIARRVR